MQAVRTGSVLTSGRRVPAVLGQSPDPPGQQGPVLPGLVLRLLPLCSSAGRGPRAGPTSDCRQHGRDRGKTHTGQGQSVIAVGKGKKKREGAVWSCDDVTMTAVNIGSLVTDLCDPQKMTWFKTAGQNRLENPHEFSLHECL